MRPDMIDTCMWHHRCTVSSMWVGLTRLTGGNVQCNVSSSQGSALWGMPCARQERPRVACRGVQHVWGARRRRRAGSASMASQVWR